MAKPEDEKAYEKFKKEAVKKVKIRNVQFEESYQSLKEALEEVERSADKNIFKQVISRLTK